MLSYEKFWSWGFGAKLARIMDHIPDRHIGITITSHVTTIDEPTKSIILQELRDLHRILESLLTEAENI